MTKRDKIDKKRLTAAPDQTAPVCQRNAAPCPTISAMLALKICKIDTGGFCKTLTQLLVHQALKLAHQLRKAFKKQGELVSEHRQQQNEKQDEQRRQTPAEW